VLSNVSLMTKWDFVFSECELISNPSLRSCYSTSCDVWLGRWTPSTVYKSRFSFVRGTWSGGLRRREDGMIGRATLRRLSGRKFSFVFPSIRLTTGDDRPDNEHLGCLTCMNDDRSLRRPQKCVPHKVRPTTSMTRWVLFFTANANVPNDSRRPFPNRWGQGSSRKPFKIATMKPNHPQADRTQNARNDSQVRLSIPPLMFRSQQSPIESDKQKNTSQVATKHNAQESSYNANWFAFLSF
jgi:hypothetical protein